MDFKAKYFDLWKSAWNFHKRWFNNDGSDDTWKQIVEESGDILKEYENMPQYDFIKSLLLSVIDELEKNGKKNYFTTLKLLILVVALVVTIIFNEGIDKEFAGYIITALSIFIGLNINLIIMIFDKFNSTNFDVTNKTHIERVRLLKRRNFFRGCK